MGHSNRQLAVAAAIAILFVLASGCAAEAEDSAVRDSTDLDESSASAAAEDSAVRDSTDLDESDEIDEPIVFCLSEKLYVSTVWLENPVFGEPRPAEETYSDGSVGRFEVVDLESAANDERSVSALRGAVTDASTPAGYRDASAATPSEDGVDVAFVVSHFGGFNLAGLIDVVDGRILAWTGCEGTWRDYTELLTEWAGSSSPDKILGAMRQVVLASRQDTGHEARGAETNRLFELATAAPAAYPAWIDRPASERSLVDIDTPDDVTARLDSMLISIDGVREVGDPDLVICPVQTTATSGYCFSIDALANAYDPSVIRIAVLPDEPVRLMLGRESLWNVPDHEVEVGSLPARTEAAALRIKSGPVDRAADIVAIASSMGVRLDVAAKSDIDVSPGVQFLGGTEPYEGA